MNIMGLENRTFSINNVTIEVVKGEEIEVSFSEGRRIVLNGAGAEIAVKVKEVEEPLKVEEVPEEKPTKKTRKKKAGK